MLILNMPKSSPNFWSFGHNDYLIINYIHIHKTRWCQNMMFSSSSLGLKSEDLKVWLACIWFSRMFLHVMDHTMRIRRMSLTHTHNIYIYMSQTSMHGKLIACFEGLDVQNLLKLLGSPWIEYLEGGVNLIWRHECIKQNCMDI